MKWFLAAVKQYATFSGRAQRSEYWFFFLFWWLIYIGLAIVDGLIFGTPGILAGLFAIGMFLPSIAVSVRRLHDTNRSGWWFLLNALPLIGWLILFIFTVQDSQSGANSFGPNPKGVGDNQSTGETVPVRGSKALIVGISAAVAVPVLGILLAVALPAYQKYVERAKNAEASAGARTPAQSAQQATTGTRMQGAAQARAIPVATPAVPVAQPPVAADTMKPAIETPRPLPVVTAPPPAKTNMPVAQAKTKTRDESAQIRVVSESAEVPKIKPKAKMSECVYKPVMSDEDIAKCR
jgi:uncharacterized membrane protein YhaH (DUF805 family)/Tfp pilus assembly major pilin PilA